MKRLLPLLLALCAFFLGLAVLAGLGWYRAASGPVNVERLSPEERQKLTEEMLAVSAGVFEPAWFEPAIGYTLRRNATIEAWGGTFRSNEIGFRSGAVAKAPGTYRVLFVGDSWTFGMGVSEREAFPKVFERLANERGAEGGKIEAWTLGLPGWNTFAELSALWFYFDRLQPDAVVLAPTSNDNHSLARVLPNGSLANVGLGHDEFGDPLGLVYRQRHLDSYRARERWRQAFAAIRETEQRLNARGVPLWLYFVARWRPAFAHQLVADAGLTSPYFINPTEFTLGEWQLPPPVLHGTAAANALSGAMVYDALSGKLGWQSLPETVERPRVRLWETPPDASAWREEVERLYTNETGELPERFLPGPDRADQLAGPLDPRTGLMGRATAILLRRAEGVETIAITVRKLAHAPALYPMELVVEIPSKAGGARHVETIPAGGDERHRFTVSLPKDVAVGAALDVFLIASRTAQAPETLAARSLFIEAIEPFGGHGGP